jgi:hypothetical protein
MRFRPIDETSLRHLFSSAYSEDLLRLAYLGPVLTSTGTIESSPDCIVLDMRSHPFKALRCEFKFIPSSKDDFSRNGRFDIAIIWSLPPGLSKENLEKELLKQNGCSEVVVLAERKAFQELPSYTAESLSKLKLSRTDIVRSLAIRRELPSVFTLCIAALIYPDKIHMDRMIERLTELFPSVKKMHPKGRGNVVGAFLQTKPPFLKHMHGKFYRWTDEIDNVSAASELTELIRVNFGHDPPTDEDCRRAKSSW